MHDVPSSRLDFFSHALCSPNAKPSVGRKGMVVCVGGGYIRGGDCGAKGDSGVCDGGGVVVWCGVCVCVWGGGGV